MKKRKTLDYLILLFLIPVTVFVGIVLFKEKQYAPISLIVAVLSMVPFIIHFENEKQTNTVRLVLIAVMISLSVAGRFVFSYVPHFKPVTAVVIIAGVYLGAESGFLCGAMSALISNFIFGQGAWTPFQMFAWGMIGFMAGIMSQILIRHKIILLIFGAVCGVWYSLLLDTWTSIYIDGTLKMARYLALIATALPITVVYAVSNVLFLILLFKPIGRRIERMTVKYGLK